MTEVTFLKTKARHPFECSICAKDRKQGVSTLEHRTGEVFHRFCEECLSPWLNRKRTCPTCRGAVTMTTTSQTLNNAALRGNLPVLQSLLSERNSISQDVLDEIFLTAVQNKRAGCVLFLLSREISAQTQESGFETALEFGYLDIAQIIRPNFRPTLSEKIHGFFQRMINK